MQLPSPFSAPSLPRPSFLNNSNNSTSSSANTQSFSLGPGLPKHSFPNSNVPAQQNGFRPRAPNHSKQRFRHSFNYLDRSIFPFSCDRCDRSYKTQQLLDQHIAEHVPCGLDGCKFVAHPKIVYKHIQMQHETGLASKIMALNTPEEIAKWREERKKKFPTAENVAKKEAERQEKIQRGELLEKPGHGFGRRGRGGASRGQGRGRGGRQNSGHNAGRQGNFHRKSHETAKPAEPAKILESKPLTSNVSNEKEEGEIDDEEDLNVKKSLPVTRGSSNALVSLMGAYATDSEEEENEKKSEEEAEKVKIKDHKEKEEDKLINPQVEDTKEVKEDTDEQKKGKRKSRKRKNKTENNKQPTKMQKIQIRPKRLTLLQKLLQGEIRHERNIILQCVHYIVQQKFFGIGQ